MIHAASVSAPELALSTFFAVLGAFLSVALAVWVDVSGATDRWKARHREKLAQKRQNSLRASCVQPTRVVNANRKYALTPSPSTRGRFDRVTDMWLIVLALKPLMLGGLLTLCSLSMHPVLIDLGTPETVEVLVILPMFIAGLFLVSWTWAAQMSTPLAMRVLSAAGLPIGLFVAVYFQLLMGGQLLGVVGSVLSCLVVGLPILSVFLRSGSGRWLRSAMSWVRLGGGVFADPRRAFVKPGS